jgi:DNA-binding MarR family transcriptional regulator
VLTSALQSADRVKKFVSQTKHMFDSRNKRLIAETVLMNPDKEYYVRELAEEVGVAPSTVSRVVDDLEEMGVVELEKDLKTEIRASKTDRFRDLKRSFNLWKLAETDLIEKIQEEAVPEAIILFGSYSRGEDSDGSDVDIAVVNGTEKDLELSSYREELGRKVNVHFVEKDEVSENFLETLANGTVLRGYLEI